MKTYNLSEAMADFSIPKKAAFSAIIRLWEDRNPSWIRSKPDYRHAASLWDDCGKDFDVVADIMDRAIVLCESDRFWAKNRTLRFVASRTDELLNMEGGGNADPEWESEEWVRDVGIVSFRLEDRGGLIRTGREALGSYQQLRAVLERQLATAPFSTDSDILAAIEGAAERDGSPGGDVPGPRSRRGSSGDSLF